MHLNLDRINHPSAWNDHPQHNKTGLYKFSSVEINLDQRIKVTNRQSYSFLDWIGDCGGLKDGIYLIGSILMAALSSYNLDNSLLTTLFRIAPS